MDSNYLDELKKLKEQKDADMELLQEEASMNIPDLEETEVPVEEDTFAPSSETIKFEPVSQSPDEKGPAPEGGRRARMPSKEELAASKKKKRTRNIVLISLSSFVALVAVLLIVFFAITNANKSKFTYEYWGMGFDIENGIAEYDFFGNIKTLTRNDSIGQPEFVAEFKNGYCIKETQYNAEGNVLHYYTHEYENGERVLSSYFENGQLVISERYTRKSTTAIQVERTYHNEEGRTESILLTLKDGKIAVREIFKNNFLHQRTTHDGTMITGMEQFDVNGALETKTIYEYNREKKQLLTEIVYDANNKVLSRKENKYGETGLLDESTCYDGDGNFLYSDTYRYNHSKNPFRQTHYILDPEKNEKIPEYTISNTFDNNNCITETVCQKPDGEIIYQYQYSYDENGYIATQKSYQGKSLEWYIKYTRTASGTVTQEERYNANNILLDKKTYNDKGLIAEQSVFDDAGKLIMQTKNQYDAKSKKNRQIITTYAEDGSVLKTVDEQLDANGNVTIRTTEEPVTGTYTQVLYNYNENGVVDRLTYFEKNGQTKRSTGMDEKGRVVNETLYENGFEKEYNEFEYNEKDQISAKKSTDRRTGAFRRTTYTYTEAGLLDSSIETDEKNTILNTKKYDEAGRTSEEALYNTETGMISAISRFQYDEQNRVIVCEKYDNDHNLISKTLYYYRDDGSYDYTVYDEKGNVIEDSRNPDIGTSTDDTDSETSSDDTLDDTTDTSDTTDSSDNSVTSDVTDATDSGSDSVSGSASSKTDSDTDSDTPSDTSDTDDEGGNNSSDNLE